MTGCPRFESGNVELYFYDELEHVERASMARHLATCGECRQALDELTLIRTALSTRPVVSAPPGEDWSGFMARLNEAVAIQRHAERDALPREPRTHAANGSIEPPATEWRRTMLSGVTPYLALAALLALVTMSAAYVARAGWGRERVRTVAPSAPLAQTTAPRPPAPAEADPGALAASFAALSEQHFERSKLVVLGVASKDPRRARLEDWEYERQLASSLLTDTRMYRAAAEERGMTSIADVMRDLELVLLQTSLAAHSGPEDLAQIQRLIDRRDLVTKMEFAAGI